MLVLLAMIGGGEQSEILHAPTLAKLMQELNARQIWEIQDGVPLAVDPITFKAAEEEMKVAMDRQGRPLATRPDLRAPHFLLRGIPVVTYG